MTGRAEKKQIKLKRMRSLLEELKHRRLTTLEARDFLNNIVGKRMVELYFAELIALGLVEYDKNSNRFQLAGHRKIHFDNEKEFNLFRNHCKELFLGLDAILWESIQGSQLSIECESDILSKFDGARVDDLKYFIEQHLRTGYPQLYEKIEKYREIRKQNRSILEKNRYPEKIIKVVVDGIATFPDKIEELDLFPFSGNIPKDLTSVLELQQKYYGEIEKEFRIIKWKVILGGILVGECDGCPNIKFIN